MQGGWGLEGVSRAALSPAVWAPPRDGLESQPPEPQNVTSCVLGVSAGVIRYDEVAWEQESLHSSVTSVL